MAHSLRESSEAMLRGSSRSLILIWQNPASRKFSPVGKLVQLDDGRYEFSYAPSAVALDGFYPLAEFPSFDKLYMSDRLPAFFANRVMSHDRPSYSDYRSWLGLTSGMDTPIEVLARTGGNRATDTFHLLDAPLQDGRLFSRFFVSGISHVDEAAERLASISEGDRLEIRAEADNPANSRALLVEVSRSQEVGWVPDWLVDEVHRQLGLGAKLELWVERVNLSAPDHLKLLVGLSAS